MKLRFVKSKVIQESSKVIKANLNQYRTGNFDATMNDPDSFFESQLEFDENLLKAVACKDDDFCEVACCVAMYQALAELSPYLARDERVWIYLTHTLLLDYTRKRWPIPTDDTEAVSHIRNHFFCDGARGIERNNAASRLWWMASLCNRTSDLTLNESLECFLHQSDVRANIVERPTTSQNSTVFTVILRRLHQSYITDKALHERKRFRAIMASLNLRGGIKLLGVLPEKTIEKILDECIAECEGATV